MNIPGRLVTAIRQRARNLPAAALHRPPLDYMPRLKPKLDPDRMARRVAFLSRGGAQPSGDELERLMGSNDLVDEFYLERALLAAHPVCRVSLRTVHGHERGCATGFMISPRLLLTNEHVFGTADDAAPSIAEFNYRFDVAGRPETSYRFGLRPDIYFFSDRQLDFAVVAVEPRSDDATLPLSTFGYHRLIAEQGKTLLKEWMNIIQHPGGARRQFAIRENQCVKIDDPDVLWYVSDTAQGSSGSPVFNDSFQVVALHHAGEPRRDAAKRIVLKDGRKVTDLTDVPDVDVDWIANSGIRVSRICATLGAAPDKNDCVAEWKAAQQGGDVLSTAYARTSSLLPAVNINPRLSPSAGTTGNRLVLGSLVLELNVGVADALQPPAAPASTASANGTAADATGTLVESFKQPIIDPNYETRTGFDTKFLGLQTPFLTITDPKLIARTNDGRKDIRYEHFTVFLHRARKLAIYTAANVDGRAQARTPEPGRDYTRKGLSGLGKNDREAWKLDPRVSTDLQIPDEFYNKDSGSFDKGHIVRREDVCFGKTFAEVQRANGDTYHAPNCSPQRGNFNQSGMHGIWGDLENFIGAQADKEQYCIFAGPVLSPADKTFTGSTVQIPSRFWKVVCAVKNKKLQVFAFVLEQDLTGVPLEFQVDARWKHSQVKLKDLETIIGLLKFPVVYHKADQA